MATLTVNHQTMYYQTVGQGTPVLLMHGWVMVSDEMLPLANEIAALGHRVVVPDLPGYGKSAPPFRGFPPDFYHRDAATMAAFLDALGETNVHIMGFSDGGETALLLPTLRPDLCRTVIAWGAIGSFPPYLCEQQRRGLPHTWITDYHRNLHPGQNIDLWPHQWVEAFCAMCEAGGDVSLSKADRITCPLLIMLGDQDRLNPADYGQRFVDRVGKQRARLHVFPGIGHDIYAAQPIGFMEAVRTFWSAHGQR
jgi:valacyclovir hydrolase